jgi:hypothetical protein
MQKSGKSGEEMMIDPQEKGQRRWNLALTAHLFVYLIAWLFALYSLSVLPVINFSADHTHFIAAVMLWLPVLALHVTAHIAAGRQNRSMRHERKIYREGFADGMAARQEPGERIALNDEDELIDFTEKPKRDHAR